MEISKDEKELLKILVEKELKKVDAEEEELRPPVGFLAAEEKYELFLKELIKKLE